MVPVAKADDGPDSETITYDQKTDAVFETAGGTTYEHHTSASLTVTTNDYEPGYHSFRMASDHVVTESGGEAMPVTEAEGYDDDPDSRVDHPAAANAQQFDFSIDNADTNHGQLHMSGRDIYMSPAREDGTDAYDDGPNQTFAAAASALLGIGAAYLAGPHTGATIAGTSFLVSLIGDTITHTDAHISEFYSTPFFRGSTHATWEIEVYDDEWVSSQASITSGNDPMGENWLGWNITATPTDVYVNQP
ncbi:hypothetical protein [Halovivax limisalsi]|uniref:hypothetical protein n=1 Tax=Halovivax limisalsi TaxID=1453760 RepID=UPI001FFD7390|nr:hypothetical protein [Halovivax limisalsi]